MERFGDELPTTLVGRSRLLLSSVVILFLVILPGSALAQKTDSVTVLNGDRMLGEIKGLQRGQLEFKTDAMGTVYVKWPKVVTVKTDKTFEIQLDDGRVLFGSLIPGSQDSVVIKTDSQSVSVATQGCDQLIRPRPRPARHAVLPPDENRRQCLR